MILNIHSDALYLSELQACSRAAGYFFLGTNYKTGKPIPVNGTIYVYTGIFKFVVASATKPNWGHYLLTARKAQSYDSLYKNLDTQNQSHQFIAITKQGLA